MEADTFELQVEFPHYCASLLSQLNKHRLGGQFCDIIIRSHDGATFHAHTAVLAAASRYFHDQFLLLRRPGHAGTDGELQMILPEAVTASVFERMLESAYTGNLRIALENSGTGNSSSLSASSITTKLTAYLTAASFLQMWHVVDRCNELLQKSGGSTASTDSVVSASANSEASISHTSGAIFRPLSNRSSENQSPSSSTNTNIQVGHCSSWENVLEQRTDTLGMQDRTPPKDSTSSTSFQNLASEAKTDIRHIKIEPSEEEEEFKMGDCSIISDASCSPRLTLSTPLSQTSSSNTPSAPVLEELMELSVVSESISQTVNNSRLQKPDSQRTAQTGIFMESASHPLPRSDSGSFAEIPAVDSQGFSSQKQTCLINGHHQNNHLESSTGFSVTPGSVSQTSISTGGAHGLPEELTCGGMDAINKPNANVHHFPEFFTSSNSTPGFLSQSGSIPAGQIDSRSPGETLSTSNSNCPPPSSVPSLLHAQVDRISRFGKRIFGCLCGKRFPDRGRRDRHVLLKLSARPFGCSQCNKSFKLKHHLTEHMIVHMDRPLHACDGCGKKFKMFECFQRHTENCQHRVKQPD
uniref:Zinc finger and BTB domain-containing protein 22-like n=1 Tax=Erpetoichthys calabaricus TaxID=27687 RepID=A0A8C4RGA7_ERPCA